MSVQYYVSFIYKNNSLTMCRKINVYNYHYNNLGCCFNAVMSRNLGISPAGGDREVVCVVPGKTKKWFSNKQHTLKKHLAIHSYLN